MWLVSPTVMKVFRTGPEFRILAIKMIFQKGKMGFSGNLMYGDLHHCIPLENHPTNGWLAETLIQISKDKCFVR